MSDNAFGIQPEQRIRRVFAGYAVSLSSAELYEQELRDKKQEKADKEKARDDSSLARERFVDILSWVSDQPDSPLQQFCQEFIEWHRPSEWSGGLTYHATCATCIEPDCFGGSPSDWPCREVERLEEIIREHRQAADLAGA